MPEDPYQGSIDPARRNRNALIGLVALLLAGAAFLGAFWLANREASNDPSGSAAWLTFTREGGIAGHVDRLTLTEEGEAGLRGLTNEPPTRYEVPEDLMERVRDAVEDVDWEEVEGPPAEPECCDLITFRIRHDDRIAYVSDISERTDELDALIGVLMDVVREAPG